MPDSPPPGLWSGFSAFPTPTKPAVPTKKLAASPTLSRMPVLTDRLNEWRRLPWPPWFRWAVSPAAVGFVLTLLYHEWKWFHDKVEPYLDFVLRWPWYAWVILGLVAVVVATLEASFRKGAADQLTIKNLEVEREAEVGRFREQLRRPSGLELLPEAEEYDAVATIEQIIADPGDSTLPLETTFVQARLHNIWIVNNDDHQTEVLRLWLRVCDPATGEEIPPLSDEALPKEARQTLADVFGGKERFEPIGQLHDPGRKLRYELKFNAFFPGAFWRKTREGKAGMISLCAKSSRLPIACCALSEEFFLPIEPRPALTEAMLDVLSAQRRIARALPPLLQGNFSGEEHAERRRFRRTEEKRHLDDLRSNELETYRRAVTGLEGRAKAIHEAMYGRLKGARSFGELSDPLEELEEMRLWGAPDLAVDITLEGPLILFRKEGGRRRFLIASQVSLTNQEPHAVSLILRWWLRPDLHDDIHFMPDNPPLKEWEAQKGEHPWPTSPALPTPICLGPAGSANSSAMGEWHFFIDDDLESETPTLEKVRGALCWFEVADSGSGKRAKSASRRLSLDALRLGSLGAVELT